ncbi:hypothetical protein HPB51_028027 [Rhipicephalus microplus]|uniref:Uncharacterized protein n=1 Tax=Rhipicephalus microplus TaxID=6941 RepID=A0A9J6CYB0_RHIMP|nr:hypothetical protein HPB51_028027 [Rhipicephalus microplus]
MAAVVFWSMAVDRRSPAILLRTELVQGGGSHPRRQCNNVSSRQHTKKQLISLLEDAPYIGAEPRDRSHRNARTGCAVISDVTLQHSPFRSSELDSVNTRSSSAIGSGGAATEEGTYDTDALMPISIPTLTVTSRQGERTTCNDPTLSSSLCQSHSRNHIPAYALLSPAESSLDAAGTTGETDVHHPVVSTDKSSQHVIACKTEQVAMAPRAVPRVEQWSEAMKEPDTAVGDNAVPPQERKSRKSKADLSAEAAGPQRPVPLPRRIKDILSSNISSVLRTSRNNMMVTDRATLDESLTVRTTSPTPCISPSTPFPVSPTLTESTDKTHASGTICVRRQRYMPTSREFDDQATGETTIGTTAVAEASFSGSKSKAANGKEKKVPRKNASLPHFFLGRHGDSEGGDDASSVRSESSGTPDGLRLSVIMTKLGILPPRRFFSSSTTPTDKGGSSEETVVPSRHCAGDRRCPFSNDADRASLQPAAISTGVSSSVVLPRVWPEPSTSFSVVETSDMESVIVDDSCVDALSLERNAFRRERRDDRRRRNPSPARSVTYGAIASPDPEWYSCSSRMSEKLPTSRPRERKTSC